ncbi:hypothetical protein D3C76_1134340 [compost metagenome]
MQDAHRAQVRVLDATHQLLAGLLAVHGHRHGALEQRHAHDAVTQAEAGVGVRDLLGFPGSGGGGHVVLEFLAGARVVGVVPFQQGLQQFRVRTGAVVALAVVFQHQFPVGLFHQGGLHRHLGVLHVVRFHVVLERGQELVDGGRVFRQADEDVAAGHLHVHWLQAIFLHVEVGAHLGTGEQQATVQFVGPLVVVADQLGHLAFVADAQA